MTIDLLGAYTLLAQYGHLCDTGQFDEWLKLFAPHCSYYVKPRENEDLGLPACIMYCDSRAMLEDRIDALREANKFNIHTDRHLIGLPRIAAEHAGGLEIEAPFAVYQTDQVLVVRLGEEEGGEALKEPHVKEFDITGRPMRNWVAVEPKGVESDDQLKRWIDLALKFVKTLRAKEK